MVCFTDTATDIVQEKDTFNPGMTPNAASKHAQDIRPCSRSSGLGASPNLPSGSDPITLKYLVQKPKFRFRPIYEQKCSEIQGPKLCSWRKKYLKIMTAISAPFDFEKSNMISSAIFLAFPYGLIGNWAKVRINQ